LRQVLPRVGTGEPQPLHLPVRVGLLGPDGRDLALRLQGEYKERAATTRLLELKERERTFRFVDVPARRWPRCCAASRPRCGCATRAPARELGLPDGARLGPLQPLGRGQELARAVLVELARPTSRGARWRSSRA
jgi:hypothetical protein